MENSHVVTAAELGMMTEAQKEAWRQKVLKEVEETTAKSKLILEQGKDLRDQIDSTFKKSKEIDKKWDDMKDRFHDTMTKLAERLSESFQSNSDTKAHSMAMIPEDNEEDYEDETDAETGDYQSEIDMDLT